MLRRDCFHPHRCRIPTLSRRRVNVHERLLDDLLRTLGNPNQRRCFLRWVLQDGECQGSVDMTEVV